MVKRGGPGRGQGRKPVKQGEETITLSLRVTVSQRAKLARLGGAAWVRGKIDRAKEYLDTNGVIFIDGDFVIIWSDAIFCSGYNCYKAITHGGSDFVKINDKDNWFTTEEAARKWLSDFMANDQGNRQAD